MTNSAKLIFYLGAARSGKSRLAVQKATEISEKVAYIATARPIDEEMKLRIQVHQQSRPRRWKTIEAWGSLVPIIAREETDHEVLLIDCLTLHVSNLLDEYCLTDQADACVRDQIEKEIMHEIQALAEACQRSAATVIIVSNEVGGGLVPPSALGRVFRDIVGRANQKIAACADEVWWVCAGLPLQIKENSCGPAL